MRSIRCIAFLATVSVLAAACGCAGSKRPSQKEVAKQQWDQARAAVVFTLARDQYQSGNYDKSRKSLDEALRLDPTNAGFHVLSAKLALEQGNLEQAHQALATARELDAKHDEAEYLTGVVYQRWQKPQVAYQHYTAAEEKKPDELAYVLARAEMLVAMDRPAEALRLLQEKSAKFEHSAVIRDAAGQLLVQQGRYAEAVETLRSATALSNDDELVREHYALALFLNRQYREAADAIARLLRSETYASNAQLHLALGECQMQLSRPREARASFETACRLNGASASAWLSLTKCALQSGDTRRAELSLQKAISLEPASTDAQLLLGYLRLRQDRFADAAAAFRKANTIDARDTVSLCMLGYTMEKLGKPDQAIRCYAQALKIKPKDDLATQLMAGVEMTE